MSETSLVGQILAGGATGVIATLLLVLFLIIRESLVVGTIAKRTEARAARYEEMAIKALQLAERATAKSGDA
jgi:hypothetical protein